MNQHFNNTNYTNIYCNNKKHNSLSVCIFSHSALLAGAERALLELVKELIEDYGVICTIIVPENGLLIKKLHEVGASTFTVNYSWWCDLNLQPSDEIKLRLNKSFIEVYKFVKKYLEKANPDIILTNSIVIPWGAITALLLNKPHIWFIHEFGKLDHNFEFFLPFHKLLKIVRECSDLILTNSDAVKKGLFGYSTNYNIKTVYQYIDILPYVTQNTTECYFSKKASTKLAIIGAISKTKGQMDCVSAVSELIKRGENIELIIMGACSSFDYMKELKEIIKNNNLERCFQFLDFKENPYFVIKQADIILVCSRCEAFGRSTLEAMLLRKPVIGTNAGGTSELIKEGYSGLLYRPGDCFQLAEKIKYFIDHPEKIQEYGECGYKIAKDKVTKGGYGGKVYGILMSLKDKSHWSNNDINLFLKNLGIEHINNLEILKEEHEVLKDNYEDTINQKDMEKNSIKGSYNRFNSDILIDHKLINRILVTRLDHIGDVILSLPAVKLLRQIFPYAHITMLVGSWARPIAEKCPDINDILTFDFFFEESEKGKRILTKKEIDNLQKMLISRNFDLAIDLKRQPETRNILKLSGARYTVGYSTGKDDDWLTVSLKPPKDTEDTATQAIKPHQTTQLLKLVQAINNNPVIGDSPIIEIPVLSFEKESDKVKDFFHLINRDFIIGIHPGVGNLIKQWPLSYFSDLANLFIERNNAQIVVFGGEKDKTFVTEITDRIKNKERIVSLAGELSLEEFMSMVKYCHLFIGNDSGPCHMAGIMGVPTLVIFSGQVSPHEWHPLGKKTMSIRVDVPCSPCYKALTEHCPYDLKCLKLLWPEKVLEAIEQLLAVSGSERVSRSTKSFLY